MEIKSIIALCIAAYAIFSGRTGSAYSHSNSQDEDDMQAAIDELAKLAAEERSYASDLAISLRLSISSIGDNLWNCYVTWTIRNTGNQDYYIKDLCSTLVLAGYPIQNWIPGNRSNVFIRAGQTITLNSSINDKKLWSIADNIDKVREAIKRELNVSLLSKVNFPVDGSKLSSLLYVNSTSFILSTPYSEAENKVEITQEIPSALIYPAYAKVYEKTGSNALDW